MRPSLRSRLFAYLALAALLSTALTVLVAALLVHHQNEVQAHRTLERQAAALASVLPAQGASVYVSAPSRLGLRALTGPKAGSILMSVPRTGVHSGRVSNGRAELLYAEHPGPGGEVVVVRPARLGPDDTQSFLLSMILAGVGSAIVAALLALLLARRLTRPLNALSAASARLPADPRPVAVPAHAPRELAQLALAFNQMTVNLAKVREAQRAFLMSVSHELKTPLTAIEGYAEGLQDQTVDARESGRVIAGEAARLERLIRDLLDLARLERPEFSVAREPVELPDVAREVYDRYASQAATAGIALGLTDDDASPVLADHDRVVQVLSNLVENALRATPPGGSVTIEAHGNRLGVRDTGPGLEAADLPHAFDRFYLHERYGARDGSGLGLAIVRQLTEAMGGAASVNGERGEGAEFTVTLPPASRPAPQPVGEPT